jgi:prepilin-type N-terminal cleavage/methylation domain-containing protein
MFKRWRQRKSDGFTLIELLVVVAIIGILAALLFPAIEGALTKAKALRVGNNGRQVHLSVFDENLSLDQLDLPLIWPVENPDPAEGYTAEFVTACSSSSEYLHYLYSQGIIKGIDLSFFASPGVTPASGTDTNTLNALNNAWCVTLDIDDDTPAGTPFLFTKNFNISGTIDMMDETEPLLSTKGMPFKGKVGVVVTKGGRVRILQEKFLKDEKNDPRIGKELFNPPASQLKYLDPNGVGS